MAELLRPYHLKRMLLESNIKHPREIRSVVITLMASPQWQEFKEEYLALRREKIISEIKKVGSERDIGKLEMIDEIMNLEGIVKELDKIINISHTK